MVLLACKVNLEACKVNLDHSPGPLASPLATQSVVSDFSAAGGTACGHGIL